MRNPPKIPVQILTYSGGFSPVKNPVSGHRIFVRCAPGGKYDPVFFPVGPRVFSGATVPWGNSHSVTGSDLQGHFFLM